LRRNIVARHSSIGETKMHFRRIVATMLCAGVALTYVGCKKGPAPPKPIDEHHDHDGHDHDHDHDHPDHKHDEPAKK
jgi:hypothetical protein